MREYKYKCVVFYNRNPMNFALFIRCFLVSGQLYAAGGWVTAPDGIYHDPARSVEM